MKKTLYLSVLLEISLYFTKTLIQVPDRMNKDFSNKSAETAVALTKTFAYLNTRGLGRLKGTDLLLMYQLVRF